MSCSAPEEHDFKEAQKNSKRGDYKVALGYLDRIVKRNSPNTSYGLEAAREAFKLSFYELKNYPKAVNYLRFLVLHSGDQKERLESQKQIASIYFNDLQDYQASIIEYSKLQQMPHSDLEAAQYKLSVARAQFYLNNFFQAESEIDTLLKLKAIGTLRAGALLLKGNILIARKEYPKAIDVFKTLMAESPEYATQENVGLTLAVCYEENNNFKDAIRVLESFRGKYSPPEYIELRLKRLSERLKNAPGAKGFKK